MHRERLVLLTTTGARTGQPHTTPMMFVPDDGRVLVIASNMGAPKDPDWYVNLCVNPRVKVEIGDESYEAEALPLTGDEYDRLWSEIKEKRPSFADHEKQATAPSPSSPSREPEQILERVVRGRAVAVVPCEDHVIELAPGTSNAHLGSRTLCPAEHDCPRDQQYAIVISLSLLGGASSGPVRSAICRPVDLRWY